MSGTEDNFATEEDSGGFEINPPEGDKEPPPLNSTIEVDVEGRGIFYCKVQEFEDDGAVILYTQDGEFMNIYLEDFPWSQVYKCDECGHYGYRHLSCDKCKVLRPHAVAVQVGDEDIGEI